MVRKRKRAVARGYKIVRRAATKVRTYVRRVRRGLRPITSAAVSGPFRPKLNTKLVYTDVLTVGAPIAGVVGTEQDYRLNSVFDPDFTGGAKQPLYFDQVAPLYRRYIVHGVRVRLIWSNPSADGVVGVVSVGFNSVAGLTLANVIQKPMTYVFNVNNTGSQKMSYDQYVPCHKVLSMTKRQYNDDISNTGALVTANPTQSDCILRLGAVNDSTAAAGATITCQIQLTYYVTFQQYVFPSDS